MGRGEGSSGDSSKSFGSFSGGSLSRSFSSGWGGSNRGRGGEYSSPSKSNYSPTHTREVHHYHDRKVYIDRGPGYYRKDYTRRAPSKFEKGCSTIIAGIVLIIALIVMIWPLYMSIIDGCDPAKFTDKDRIKLAPTICRTSPKWIDDRVDWLDNENKVISSMKYFYSKTGIQPYLIICDEINGKKDFSDEDAKNLLEETYSSLYKDEGHMILLFCEPYDSKYYRALFSGTAASTLVDKNAQNIIYNLIDSCYYDADMTDDEYFAKIFQDSATRMMAKYKSAEEVTIVFLIVLGVAIALILIGIFLIRRRLLTVREKEANAKILNAPLQDIDNPTEDIENKYK